MVKFPRLFLTLVSAILLMSATSGQTQKQKTDSYISQYKELAIAEMLRTGVPAAVTLAQGILETAGGQSDLASIGNNHFGIKCKSEWTGETMLHNDDAKNECFRKYSSAEDSYKDHSDFLRLRPAYAFLFKLDPTDYEGWANGLKKAGYATCPTYAHKLIKIIVENNLQDYSLVALQRKETGDNFFATAAKAEKKDAEVNEVFADEQPSGKENVAVEGSIKTMKENSKNEGYPVNAVFNINELKVIYAKAGTSLLALANNYNVSLKKLLEFNELEQTDILNAGQLIFLQKKSKKGTKEIHIVQDNETLRDISQTEGMQLSMIMEYNGLQKNMQPATGEKIYLKYPAPATPRLVSAGYYRSASSM